MNCKNMGKHKRNSWNKRDIYLGYWKGKFGLSRLTKNGTVPKDKNNLLLVRLQVSNLSSEEGT